MATKKRKRRRRRRGQANKRRGVFTSMRSGFKGMADTVVGAPTASSSGNTLVTVVIVAAALGFVAYRFF